MNLFNLFSRRRKKTIKELYEPVLDEMWCCIIQFRPWEPENHKVVFKKVKILKAEATPDGIWVESNFQNPFEKYSKEMVKGYIDTIVSRFQTSGFFETEKEAKMAYNALMNKWISVIKSGLVEIE